MPSEVDELILKIQDPNQRNDALSKLSKMREEINNLALLLWYSYGTMAAILQEVVAVYPLLDPPNIQPNACTRLCNALALLQCIASHPETKLRFIHAQIPIYLFPFMKPDTQTKQFEYLRLTSLGVIGALVKADEPEVISFLLKIETIPLCLQIMEFGKELSRTVATFIVQRILQDENGHNYICNTPERFYVVVNALKVVVNDLLRKPHQRTLKLVIRCYNSLSEDIRVRKELLDAIPEAVLQFQLNTELQDDDIQNSLRQLLTNLNTGTNNNNFYRNTTNQNFPKNLIAPSAQDMLSTK